MGQDPWGLSGEQFLQWYFIGVGCALALAVLIRFLPKFIGGGNHVFRPSAVEIGFLAGGPDRAVETATAELVAAGALRVGSTGMLRATGSAVRPSGAIAAQVLARAAASQSLRGLAGYLRTQAALWDVGGDLAELGLVVRPHVAARFRFGSSLPLLAVLVIGVIRWANGLSLGRAVGNLTFALLATIVLFVVLLNFRRRRHIRTFAGDRALRELRRATPLHDAAAAVAFGGVRKYPDLRIAGALQQSIAAPARRLAGTSAAAGGGFFFGGGGCGGGGGSSCGGGGGGGGGGCGG